MKTVHIEIPLTNTVTLAKIAQNILLVTLPYFLWARCWNPNLQIGGKKFGFCIISYSSVMQPCYIRGTCSCIHIRIKPALLPRQSHGFTTVLPSSLIHFLIPFSQWHPPEALHHSSYAQHSSFLSSFMIYWPIFPLGCDVKICNFDPTKYSK